MYVNNCAKCGTEFETKNPKRVICPNCLYPERPAQSTPSSEGGSNSGQSQPNMPGKIPSFHAPPQVPPPPQGGGYGPPRGGGRPPQGGGYGPPRGGGRPPQGGGYGPPRGGGRPPQGGGYGPPRGGGRPPQGGGYGPPRGGGYGPPQGGRPQGGYGPPRGRGGPPRGRGGPPKKLLVSREDMERIEVLYKQFLPLPNPDVHEVIGEKLDMKPSMVFFGINLIREKMRLPKLEYPKRRLALTPDQLMAIESLYEPYMPVPPIGIHKILAKQLRIDEWRVHVGIGLIRKNKNMPRWNEERDDLPEAMKKSLAEKAEREKAEAEAKAIEEKAAEKEAKKEASKAKKTKKAAESSKTEDAEGEEAEATEKPKKTRTKKAAEPEEPETGEAPAKKPVRKTRAKAKVTTEEATDDEDEG